MAANQESRFSSNFLDEDVTIPVVPMANVEEAPSSVTVLVGDDVPPVQAPESTNPFSAVEQEPAKDGPVSKTSVALEVETLLMVDEVV